jgi:putative effector of murein hydrolase
VSTETVQVPIQSQPVRGFALGTCAHGIGAASAIQAHPDAGAYASLALGMQVVLASLLLPLVFKLF